MPRGDGTGPMGQGPTGGGFGGCRGLRGEGFGQGRGSGGFGQGRGRGSVPPGYKMVPDPEAMQDHAASLEREAARIRAKANQVKAGKPESE